jgi:indole-3-glycerol phosphate synthase
MAQTEHSPNILETIIASKRLEVKKRSAEKSLRELESSAAFSRKSLSLKQSILDPLKTGIIAEFKRRSPSKGVINAGADVVRVTKGYFANGASGLSILTDEKFFGGSTEDLENARVNEIPILRKDFIIDEYQVVEAKSMGADAILLIAACLTATEVERLAAFAKKLGLEVLLELHAEEELGHVCDDTELVGINNRDLKTFTVDLNRSLAMAKRIPANKIKVAESGIRSSEQIKLFKENGYRGFLIGEQFMKQSDPVKAFGEFVDTIRAH